MTAKDQKIIIHTLKKYKSLGIKYIEPFHLKKIDDYSCDLPNQLVELSSYIEHCSLCDMSKYCNEKFIGMGDINSDIFIIGTNNDFSNDTYFTILKNIIEKVILLEINEVYITNILKCKTNQRYGIENSIDLCKSYIFKQIELAKPKFIITLGDSFNHMTKDQSDILDISGNLIEHNNMRLIPIMDIEFVHKNPSYKNRMYKDLKKIKNILENE